MLSIKYSVHIYYQPWKKRNRWNSYYCVHRFHWRTYAISLHRVVACGQQQKITTRQKKCVGLGRCEMGKYLKNIVRLPIPSSDASVGPTDLRLSFVNTAGRVDNGFAFIITCCAAQVSLVSVPTHIRFGHRAVWLFLASLIFGDSASITSIPPQSTACLQRTSALDQISSTSVLRKVTWIPPLNQILLRHLHKNTFVCTQPPFEDIFNTLAFHGDNCWSVAYIKSVILIFFPSFLYVFYEYPFYFVSPVAWHDSIKKKSRRGFRGHVKPPLHMWCSSSNTEYSLNVRHISNTIRTRTTVRRIKHVWRWLEFRGPRLKALLYHFARIGYHYNTVVSDVFKRRTRSRVNSRVPWRRKPGVRACE